MCESLNLPDKIAVMINDQSIYQYDQIFITDIWLENPRIIQNDSWLKDHTLLIDHHESALRVPNFENYSFMKVKIKDENGILMIKSNSKIMASNSFVKFFAANWFVSLIFTLISFGIIYAIISSL